jgi:streptogramin lyase
MSRRGGVAKRVSLALPLVGLALAIGPAENALGSTTLSGEVAAGGAPVRGSAVELYATGNGGATLRGTGRTSANGQFVISYDNPGGDSILYAIANGGQVGRRSVGRSLRLMDVAGTAQSPLDSVAINEQTTVASAYALAQFLSGKNVAGSSPGLPNAVATVGNLVEPRSGKISLVIAGAPNGNATEALPTFNTLANVLESCTRGTGSDCRKLFAAAKPPGQAKPRNTLDAILDIAHFPRRNTRALFDLQRTGRGANEPALEAKPTAWTLALVYTAGGFDAPGRMAFDAAGRVWSNNNFEPPGTTVGLGLTVLSPTGTPILHSPLNGGGLQGAGFGMAIDQLGRAWVGNFSGNSISLFDSQGMPVSPSSGFVDGSISKPQGVAVDQQGNIWIPNFAGSNGNPSVTIYRHGNPLANQVVTGGGINNPFAIAIDASGNAWVTDNSTSPKPGAVTRITPGGTPTAITGGGLRSPQGIAVDSQGNLWVANLFGKSVTEISNAGRIYRRSPIRPPSLKGPWGIAVDGNDNVWVAGFAGENVTELCGSAGLCPKGVKTGQPISPRRSGFTSLGLQHLTAIQIDQSGNVWAANNWSSGSPIRRFVGGNGLVELIGLAAPVRTPLIGPPQRP